MTRWRLRPAARRDLGGIRDYTVQIWGREQAKRYLTAIHAAVRKAAANPMAGREFGGRGQAYLRVKSGSHLVFYRVAPEGIIIVRVLHERMNIEARLEDSDGTS